MRRNKLEVYVHFVWGTWDRQPMISEKVERRLYRNIFSEAEKLGCKIIAINGVEDHIHILVKMPSTVTMAELMKQVKGVSSNFANEHLFKNRKFKWQGGYGAFSVSRWDVDKIVGYVKKQKTHHAEKTVWPEFEEVYEEVDVE